jgi:protein prenyltransferase alpha subunit repeat containing protein 1
MVQQNLDASLVRILIASSSILLLANPSNQTALNTRKHLVRMHQIDPHAELRFLASLLSSQHCKHAELWYHRRWLLSAAYDPRFSDAASVDSYCRLQFVSQESLQRELELVSRACELYPRNYFAWTHRLICIRSLLSDYLAGMDAVGFVPIFRNEIAGIKGWIDRHVSDYSAIHTILALSQAVVQSGDLSLMEIIIEEDIPGHAISLVQEYPAHEALWMYIRTALSIPDSQQIPQIQQFVDHFVQPLVHSQHPKTDAKEDLVKAPQYARQFMDKCPDYKFFCGHHT